MPAYIAYSQMKAALPAEIMAQLLDDTGSGVPDLVKWDEVVAAVAREIDGALEQKYPLPLAAVPNAIGHAAFTLAAELLYQGRGFYADANPWSARARDVRKFLQSIAGGETQLLPTTRKTNSPASAILEPAKTTPLSGNTLT